MKIIAFGHRKRVGKDTAAKFLISHLRMTQRGICVQKAGFADKVKSLACELYGHHGLMPGDFYEQSENEHLRKVRLPGIGKTPVEIWIGVGNGLRANVHDATWYEYLLRATRGVDVLVIKDMRFPVEANGILERGGHVYRIDRPGIPEDADGADDQLVTFDRWTGVLTNDSDLRIFYEKVVEVADRLLRADGVRPVRC